MLKQEVLQNDARKWKLVVKVGSLSGYEFVLM